MAVGSPGAGELHPRRRRPGGLGAGKLAWSTKLAFGFGDAGLSATSTIIGFLLLYYLTDVAGLRPALAGAAIFTGRFYDAVTDPFEGYLSDRTQTRWGRRRPYFLFGALPFGLTFALLFLSPAGVSQAWRAVYAALAYILHMTAYTGIGVPYTALTAELTPDYDERTSLTAYRMAFSIVAGLAAAVVPLMIVGAFPSSRAGFAVMGLVFGAFTVLPPLTVFFVCREPPARPAAVVAGTPAGSAARPTTGTAVTFRDFLHEMLLTLQNRPFRVALMVFVLTWMAMDLVTATFLYFLQYVMGLAASAEVLFGVCFTVAALFLPFWVWVSQRWSKKIAYLTGISFLAAVLVGVAFLEPGMVALTFVLVAVAGVGVSTAHVIPWSMIPDCVEYDELRTGRRREGQHYGFMTFAQKVASSGALLVTGVALETSGYVAGAAQPPSALFVMRLFLGPVPAALFVLGMIALAFYPVTRTGHALVRAELEATRAEAGS